jgi:hypothetical protein
MARESTAVARAGTQVSNTTSRVPSLLAATGRETFVSLRPIKDFVRTLRPDHPLRLVISGEPDQLAPDEFCVKLTIWLRLLPSERNLTLY